MTHKRDGTTVADVVSVKNPKINTVRKVFADRNASSYGRKTPREFARQHGYKVVINADGWATNDAPYGLQIEDGRVVQDWGESPAGMWDSAILFMGDGSLRHAKRSDGITAQQWVERGALWSVCFAGLIVEDGQKVINTSPEIANAVSARTIIGQKTDGELIIIMVEGQSGKYGMTLDQAAAYAIDQGCVIAYAADGGGSTQCWWEIAMLFRPRTAIS
ncbi:phosphodiester glycosidase family protein [Neisseria subflava]|uniref:Phosphodiester glycosidase family protein n=1 Tax=Neisseria subflava TaxID=28449 RepID=A0A9X9I703_NEISU|nr:phosphodiester glycosidase family protein [Neisseria subflava]